MTPPEGILLVDKPPGKSSFFVVAVARKKSRQPKVGHSGTLDPFATGLLVLLLGRRWTRCAGEFLNDDKEYEATLRLGHATDTFDCDGVITQTSSTVPSIADVHQVLSCFQGELLQIPPMFSAKKIGGKRLYDLARKGITVERTARPIHVTTSLESYSYPDLKIRVHCSKGTYIRSLAHEIGEKLGSFAHLSELRRTRSGRFSVQDAISFSLLDQMDVEAIRNHLLPVGP